MTARGLNAAVVNPSKTGLVGVGGPSVQAGPRQPHHIQHSSAVADGKEGFIAYLYRRAGYAGRDLFQQLQPFPAQAVFERDETGGIAARSRQAVDVAGTDRIGDGREHDWHGARGL